MDHEFHSAEARRAAIVALTRKETGIDEAMIETLIRSFYARVRQTDYSRRSLNRALQTGSRISTRCSRSGRQ
jgi:hypothetical protein